MTEWEIWISASVFTENLLMYLFVLQKFLCNYQASQVCTKGLHFLTQQKFVGVKRVATPENEQKHSLLLLGINL